MPTFTFLDNLEVFLRTGKLPPDATKSAKKVTWAASKHFIFKGGRLWRSYRGRLLRVVRSEEEIREILTRYHDNNNHAGRVRAVKEIMLMYYWVGVTEAVKNWIKACSVCQSRAPTEPPAPPIQYCLAYGCETSSFTCPDLSFHRFPKDKERRRQWLVVAQRDEGSLRMNSFLCSRHFEPTCFVLSDDGQLLLSADAVPTIISEPVKEEEVTVPSDEDFLQTNALDDLLSTAASETVDTTELTFDTSEAPAELQEHQYSLRTSDPDSEEIQDVSFKRRKTVIEPTFAVYNHIARYLSHRILPTHTKKSTGAFKRMAKRFGLMDGVLMYTRVSPPLRVPRSREEVNSILQQFHDNQGHYGQGMCQREIAKHFYWGSMTRDLARWISGCHTCVNRTKRKWLRCSVYNCSNCCGPVERGLGLTFHKFPLQNPPLLAQWLRTIGRPNWHPRLWSSVCSTHFTEDCFDRSGDKLVLRPDAIPTLMLSTEASNQPQATNGEEVFFAKYDAVELYLSRHTYPPGLNYVEKNTFRRFCKKFIIKEGELHMMRGNRVRLVLRTRQQVESTLTDYHDELNHLDVNKCLRLLNERFFWKTMRPDVIQWINNCSQCSRKKGKRPENQAEGGRPRRPMHPPPDYDSDSGHDEDINEFCVDDGLRLGVTDVDAGRLRAVDSSTPLTFRALPPARQPILLRLKAPTHLGSKTPIILEPIAPNGPVVTSLVPDDSTVAPSQSEGLSSDPDQSELNPDTPEQAELKDNGRVRRSIKARIKTRPETPEPSPSRSASHRKRKKDLEPSAGPSTKSIGVRVEPVEAPSTKPWPVFTITTAIPMQTPKTLPLVDSPVLFRRPGKIQARTVIQQCCSAKVKVRPALDGVEAQWAEIQEGMVVSVCFYDGATEDVAYEMANSLMTTKLFRKERGHCVSVLDLPASVLLLPQDSLVGEVSAGRRLRFRGGAELWWGAQLFSTLVSACRDLMAASLRCVRAGASVEHGVVGQKQELLLSTAEPLTVLMEF
ncbi:uncharacterized protein LOC114456786 [Gouania willdenowi]|uniref:THAP domain-containing protein 1 n=1 Tax=Gouania willdenowi TaxID=441366 RepID=A0A8C5H2E9_GOUWI|nr:uncharacterized protein LOC114456786 [Gouania willdenowi]